MSKAGEKLTGIIIKRYSGFYYVWDGQHEWECSLRGKFRLTKQSFVPGDRVKISIVDSAKYKAVIEGLEERQNELIRPTVSNVEQAIIVMAVANPEPDFWLLDRMLVMIQANEIKPVICFNKVDLLNAEKSEDILLQYSDYQDISFPFLMTSSKTGQGLDQLREILANKISVLAGPSGVGKSSLLNKLEGLTLKTGDVGAKTERGKHTTRHVELIKLSGGGLLADTPGFSNVYLPKDMKKEELSQYYPEYLSYRKECRFNTCLHWEEPGCAVRDAVEEGMLSKGRYQRYLTLLEEIITAERRF